MKTCRSLLGRVTICPSSSTSRGATHIMPGSATGAAKLRSTDRIGCRATRPSTLLFSFFLCRSIAKPVHYFHVGIIASTAAAVFYDVAPCAREEIDSCAHEPDVRHAPLRAIVATTVHTTCSTQRSASPSLSSAYRTRQSRLLRVPGTVGHYGVIPREREVSCKCLSQRACSGWRLTAARRSTMLERKKGAHGRKPNSSSS